MKLLNKSYLRAKEIKLIIFDVDGVLTTVVCIFLMMGKSLNDLILWMA